MRHSLSLARISLALAIVAASTLASLTSVSAQCRDEAGEPAPCPAAPTPAPAPSSGPPRAPTVYDREGGYVEVGWTLSVLDLRRLRFTPQRPEYLPAVTRDLVVVGAVAPDEALFGGLQIALGMRPTSFLRFPELRFSVAGAEVDVGQATHAGSGLDASIDSVIVVRLELGGGLEAHAGPVGFYAMVRGGVAGYFAEARLEHALLGDFGRAQLAEDAFELSWELAASLDLGDEGDGLALKASVEGVHLGAEGVQSSFRFLGTF